MSDYYEKFKNYRNDSSNFATVNNAFITEVKADFAVAELVITKSSLNPIGSIHGGAYFTLADIACGAAACSMGELMTTVDAHINYMRPGINVEKLISTARVKKRGKRLCVLEFNITDENGRELCMGTATFSSIGKRVPI